jgi:dolichol-phosphate mannosyltransferase
MDGINPMMRISVVVPFYNEKEGIPALQEKLSRLARQLPSKYELECVLVDDGSQDGSERVAQQSFAGMSGVVYAKHSQNRGLGAAMRTGFSKATGDVICAIDSDCTYDPLQIPRLLDVLEKSGADIAAASPYHPEGGVENVIGWRLFLSRGASLLYRIVCSSKLYTYTSMMRAYRRAVIDSVPFYSDGFAGVTEVLLRASQQGYRVVEVPMVLHSRVAGVSKMKVMRSITMHLRLMLQALTWRLVGVAPFTVANPKEIGRV